MRIFSRQKSRNTALQVFAEFLNYYWDENKNAYSDRNQLNKRNKETFYHTILSILTRSGAQGGVQISDSNASIQSVLLTAHGCLLLQRCLIPLSFLPVHSFTLVLSRLLSRYSHSNVSNLNHMQLQSNLSYSFHYQTVIENICQVWPSVLGPDDNWFSFGQLSKSDTIHCDQSIKSCALSQTVIP